MKLKVISNILKPFSVTSARLMSTLPNYKFETLLVKNPSENVYQVHINRPEKKNAMNAAFWREIRECFHKISVDADCRAVVLSSEGNVFTAGLDLMEAAQILNPGGDKDVGRKAFALKTLIKSFQDSFTSLEKCLQPVIVAVQGACVGGGVNLITAADIRYATKDAWFSLKEVDIGLASDVGALQRLPKIVGNDSWVREIAYTARKIPSDEALTMGLISRQFDTKEEMMDASLKLAATIASKSPIAVQGTKASLVFSRDHSVPEGLEHVATWNQAMLQSEDVMKAAMASMTKETPIFPKL